MSGDFLGPLMFVVVFLFIFAGYPVAFSLGGDRTDLRLHRHRARALLLEPPLRVSRAGLRRPCRTASLLAVPFFIFMGTMLEKSRLAEDLLRTIGMLFGRLRGGLALAVVVVGAMLAAATGVVGASVVAMGLISLPVMLRYDYSPMLATGVISAAGTLGQIIPPSVVLVVLADQLGISVGDLFVGSLIPGLMLAGFYAVYVTGVAIAKPAAAPALPAEERTPRRRRAGSAGGRRHAAAHGADPGRLGQHLRRHRDAYRGGGAGRCRRHRAGPLARAADDEGGEGGRWTRRRS